MRNPRLVMMSCKGPHTTPWMLPQGGERIVRILHLLAGEHVVIEQADQFSELVYSDPGEYIFVPESRFRVRKELDAEVVGSPTIVEVLYDG